MAQSSTPAPTSTARSSALQSAIEGSGIKFNLSAGGVKYICTIKDRNTHERMKAELQASSGSTQTENATAAKVDSSASSALAATPAGKN